ncbi:MAG: DegV family protein [Gemmatimonadota bacterium]
MRIAYVDGPRFRRSLLAACGYAESRRQELNRINVFPVPDGDTGTNLALTVRAISEQLRGNVDISIGAVARHAAEASVLGARGNCGMMLSHFLLGFADRLGGRDRMDTRDFGAALSSGVARLTDALERPVEGTMLTVMRDTAVAAEADAQDDFLPFLERILAVARSSLARTPELLPALRKAGVVDAGAKGFVNLLEGVVLFVHGDPVVEVEVPALLEGPALGVAAVEFPAEAEVYRFCTEALVRGEGLPDRDAVRERLQGLGDSLIVIRAEGLLKLHIHTDEPEAVFRYLRTVGTLAAHKAEDMHVQHAAVERAAAQGHVTLARRPVSVVTDSSADLPDDVRRQHGIHVVPLVLMEGDRALRDRIDVTAEEFHRRMVDGDELPTTSQPTPQAFADTFKRAAEDGEAVIAVVLGSALSGTFGSAQAAARLVPDAHVRVFDSRAASSLLGLLALKAAELGEAGHGPDEILDELQRTRDRSGVLFTVDTFDRLIASGRVGRGRALLGSLLSVKPILGLSQEGKVVPFGKALGRERVLPAVLDLLQREIPEGHPVRFGLAHVACADEMERVARALRERFGAVDIAVAPATPVVATHTGPGAWAVAYLVEDPVPTD